jgi:hypothetical protein
MFEVRTKSSGAVRSGTSPVGVFAQHFRKTPEDLEILYGNDHWKHAAAVGGHTWRGVTAAVVRLRDAIGCGEPARVREAASTLVMARHNNGYVRHKIRELDKAIGHQTGR